ncbi:type III PLP-dependent enzyme [Dyella sp.]|uniref:type III PLP-dependent enzyme n=1 Tax=Dyella sp. TaxID=1869338 RepID=UPI002ED05B57
MNFAASLPRIQAAIGSLRSQASEPVCAYVYDLDALAAHARHMREALPMGCEIYYAAKANADAPILKALAPWVHGFEAASGGELRWLRSQQASKPLLLGGPGKLDSELAEAIAEPGCTLHVESLGELRRLGAISQNMQRQVTLFLRMNIAVEGMGESRLVMGGKPTPFGMDESDLAQAVALLREYPLLTFEGFHFHLMSHQHDAALQLRLVDAYLDIAQRWEHEHGLTVRTVNAGGGFGVDYAQPENSFDWTSFCEGLRERLGRRPGAPVLRFEPGRFVSVACGWYVMEVLDIKRSHGEHFAVARGGTHHFRTPPAQGHDHPFQVIRGDNEPVLRNAHVTLVGQLCTPKDVLARQQPVNELAIGDCLAFPLAGAYAWNISHQNFLMHAPPRMMYLGSE